MRLQYNILWVDDKKENFEDLKYDVELKNFLDKLYFVPNVILVETIQDAFKAIDSSRFDIIFSDYNIGENEKGDDFIQRVRQKNINTEILFYSAQEEVYAMNGIDRISFFNIPRRNGYKQLLVKMKDLIELTVERFQELTVIRGLVMAEVSDLDAMMQTIVKAYFTTEERMIVFHKKITNDREKTFKKMLIYKGEGDCGKKCVHKWKELPINDIANNMDASQLAHAMNIIINDKKIFYYDSYKDEIINVRNDLAHSESKIKNGKEILLTRNGGVYFDDQKFVKIRQNITKYQKIFEKYL